MLIQKERKSSNGKGHQAPLDQTQKKPEIAQTVNAERRSGKQRRRKRKRVTLSKLSQGIAVTIADEDAPLSATAMHAYVHA
mmetsp:Transcript_3046/g.5842  ORF Transcript_3046/g.5842 Transcript_3046/m.5842 type:complete len:81 (+) Transcript_3046:632-874(+)